MASSSTYHSVLVKDEFQTRCTDVDGETISDVYGTGSYAVQSGGALRAKVNAGPGELVALVFFDGPVDFVLDE